MEAIAVTVDGIEHVALSAQVAEQVEYRVRRAVAREELVIPSFESCIVETSILITDLEAATENYVKKIPTGDDIPKISVENPSALTSGGRVKVALWNATPFDIVVAKGDLLLELEVRPKRTQLDF